MSGFLLLPYSFETESFIEPPSSLKPAGPNNPLSTAQELILQAPAYPIWLFMWALGVLTQVYMLLQQNTVPTEPSPYPSSMFSVHCFQPAPGYLLGPHTQASSQFYFYLVY